MKRRKTKIETARLMTPEQAAQHPPAGCMCAWNECGARFDGPMPADWRCLLVYWQAYPLSETTVCQIATSGSCDRDAVLCPKHFRELESQLKDLMRWADKPASGQA